MFAQIVFVISTLCTAACSSCGSTEPTDQPTGASSAVPTSGSVATGNVTEIVTNTQGTFGDVRIGAGNFRDEEYTDSAGKKG
jgi:hypothetical protein